MQLIIKNTHMNALMALRRTGYHFEKLVSETKEISASRSVHQSQFPRFHAYAFIQETHTEHANVTKNLIINLHLDQKRPSYRGTAAHSGEYEGPLIEEELRRIQNILQ